MNRTAWLQDRRMEKFCDVLSRRKARELSAQEAGEILGCSERQFRHYRRRYEEEGLTGLLVPAPRRGAHRRKRPRKPCIGMMLHQDGSRYEWLEGQPELDLIATLDDATSELYSAFLVEEEGTASSFQGLLEVFNKHGLPSSLYTDRASHYFLTPRAGEPVDKERLTQVGRALLQLGIEHIPAYSPEARGRSERAFGTLQSRLAKELRLFGITDIAAANQYIREVYLPMHNKLFARPAPIPQESGFVKVRDPDALVDVLCVQQPRVVARDNTVSYEGRSLQLPQSPTRPHYVKANVRVHEYPDGTLAIFHGPRRLARYTAAGEEIVDVPTAPSVTPCSPPSRRGLETLELVARPARRPALTAPAAGVPGALQVGTKKRSTGRTKKLTGKAESAAPAAA